MAKLDPTHLPRSARLRLWLIIGTVAAALLVVPSLLLVLMAGMVTDGGPNGRIYLFLWLMLTSPLVVVMAPITAWIAFAFRKERASWILLCSPLAWVVVAVALIVIGLGDPLWI